MPHTPRSPRPKIRPPSEKTSRTGGFRPLRAEGGGVGGRGRGFAVGGWGGWFSFGLGLEWLFLDLGRRHGFSHVQARGFRVYAIRASSEGLA